MHRIKKLAIIAIPGILLLSGCRTPKHSDLLIFGTNTQFGVSVAADATSNPSINIGYKRQEVVLMPLYVNAQESKYPPSEIKADATTIGAAKYTGVEGAPPTKTDTYSVLAVFGARGEAGASVQNKETKTQVGIAQYFATGLAARTLAVAGGSLINTSDKAAEASKVTAQAVTGAYMVKPETVHELAPLVAAYWEADAGQQALYNDAAKKAGYSDIGHFLAQDPVPTQEQINTVRTELEKDAALKALIAKHTAK